MEKAETTPSHFSGVVPDAKIRSQITGCCCVLACGLAGGLPCFYRFFVLP